jgi:alkanesulfonate monooxygenase SsuD/methylene tetrahydromethanopterin reductase-like flavin-dependent oxidoreductase (luciferase family)
MNDHMHGPDPRLEAWTTLCWIAASTSRLRVATRVLGLPYRQPTVVAKMAETFDRLSNGRLILGLGAGSSDDEFRALGLEVRSLRDRIDDLGEAIQIMRGLWLEPRHTFEGRRFDTHDAQLEPKPEHAIPIWVGTHGKRGLALTGRHADGWIPSLGHAPPEQIPAMAALINRSARDAQRDPRSIAWIYNVQVRIDGDTDPDQAVVAGEPDEVADRLARFVKLGFSGFNLMPTGAHAHEQVALLGAEVIPAVRATL